MLEVLDGAVAEYQAWAFLVVVRSRELLLMKLDLGVVLDGAHNLLWLSDHLYVVCLGLLYLTSLNISFKNGNPLPRCCVWQLIETVLSPLK